MGHKENKTAELTAELTAGLRKLEQKLHTLQIENEKLIGQVQKLQAELFLAKKDLAKVQDEAEMTSQYLNQGITSAVIPKGKYGSS